MNEQGSEVGDAGCKRVEEAVPFAKAKHVVVETNFDLHRGRDGDASSPGDFCPYPKPSESYEDVVADPKLFRETLEKLHSTMGTKFMVPIIGGKDLNLHRLFVEVTSRGGIEKVIADRRWREVTATFTFPSTATNASFVLRKYYMSLLRHYEQIYFFRSQGWSSPAPTKITSGPWKRSIEHNASHLDQTLPSSNKRKKNNGLASPQYPQVVGVIDGKFEHGYFVTVNVGSETLRGVLFHIPQQTSGQATRNTNIADNINNLTSGRRRRRRKKLSKRDPSHPKPNRSGYNFFFAEQHARLKPLYPGKDREISKIIGDSWNKLTESEKVVYQDRGLKDKERYRSEMAVYMEKLKSGHVISNAVPIQQRPAEPEVVRRINPKLHNIEGDIALNGENDYSSESNDLVGKLFDEDSDMEASPELGGGSASMAEPSAEGDDFELRRRVDSKSEGEHDLCSFSQDTLSRKFMESTDKQ
ncbi:high mobility group B protein 15 [Canna indica]|uniref:High mobility group B protein 15 n=1 Tax=Canna indica TaxID=4628 RepID=A0AAQ3K3V6_9LILI|nr:high mobility group B protein 15 [Canna indica]